MKNLKLHRYFTVNLFIYINFINFLNFTFFIVLNFIKFQWILHFLENIYFVWFLISLIGIPISGIFVIVEFVLRKFNIIHKSFTEILSQHQIKFVYLIAFTSFILYISFITYCLQPPSPAEIESMRYD